MKPRIKEKDITRAIRDFLDFKRIFHWKQFQTLGSTPGVADIIGIERKTGRMIAIEVKTPYGRVNPKQEQFLLNVRANGGIAFVARSVQDVIDHLRPYF